MTARLARAAFAAAFALLCPAAASALPAFPEAVGYGKDVAGGRSPSAAVCRVTTTADAGPGSLRDCLGRANPDGTGVRRYVVFATGGRIVLQSPLVAKGNVTISGRTAPGGGIEVTTPDLTSWCGAMLNFKGTNGANAVVRYLRLRPGRTSANVNNCRRDALLFENTGDGGVMVDHVSLAFGSDENLDLYKNNRNVTVSGSILGYGLKPHSKGALLCDDNIACGRMTFYRNTLASNRDRNPDIHTNSGDPFDFVNNVIYNPSDGTEVWRDRGGPKVNVVGNDYRAGPNSNSSTATVHLWDINATGLAAVYAPLPGSGAPANHVNLTNLGRGVVVEPAGSGDLTQIKTAPAAPLSVEPSAASTVWDKIGPQVGAALPVRDGVDAALVACVRNRAGCPHMSAPAWGPAPATGTPPADRDGDGMPDSWETGHGTNPAAFDANADRDGDGYPNIEDWLHGI